MEASPLLGETRLVVGDAVDGLEASGAPPSFASASSVTPSGGWPRSARALAVVATVATLACAGFTAKAATKAVAETAITDPTSTLGVISQALWERYSPRAVSAVGSALASDPPDPDQSQDERSGDSARDEDTTITVGFLSSGDFFWLPMVKLLEAALPGVTVRLSDPTYNWRALGLDQARGLRNVEIAEGPVEPDVVLEGPDIFKTVCFWEDRPWVQTTAEPTMFFNTWNWCAHDRPAFLRLDTGLGHYKQPTVYDENATTFVWSPYAMTQAYFNAEPWLLHRKTAFEGAEEPANRPAFVGFVSANCRDHRSRFFDALVRVSEKYVDPATGAAALRDSVHAMGPCNHNRDWSDSEPYPPRELRGFEIYRNYRWVLALENVAEPGYLTEKLVNAFASGAVPVYYGDSRAARKVFKKESFVDAFEEWTRLGVTPSVPPSDEDWETLARRIVEIDRDPESYRRFVNRDSVLQDYPEGETWPSFEKTVHYPNEPFPLVNRALADQTDGGSGASGEAVRKLRALFPEKVRKVAETAGGGVSAGALKKPLKKKKKTL